MSNKATPLRPHVTQNEGLIFERSSPGKRGVTLSASDVPTVDPKQVLGPGHAREDIPGFPEVSELDVVRHYTRLSTWNYGVDTGLYPLGSCTMKYNARINEVVSRLEGPATDHPFAPQETVQGCLKILFELEQHLKEITGMDRVSLQPAAGAQGELTGLLMIRAHLTGKGNPRKKILVPDSAHGTNPASVNIAGYETQDIQSNNQGCIDLDVLSQAVTDEVAGLMLTNPNTLGIFEDKILEISDLLHSKGALLYMDGANMNALVGVSRPGDFGVDVMHLNLHKTFSTPHGGGGPGSGPVAVKNFLEPYLPTPTVERDAEGRYFADGNRPQTVGRVRAFYGNFGMAVRALAYILANGPAGLRQTTEDAVLNANYIQSRLKESYDLPYDQPCLHECVFSDSRQAPNGVRTMDIAKRLIDYGFHPYTTAFPLIVPGALMIEPTESADQRELDEFIEAMLAIAEEAEHEPETVRTAPHTTRLTRLDEVTAARKPILRWNPDLSQKQY